jgi:hypothetical protein
MLAFIKIVEEAGSSFAFPSQSIYVEGVSETNPLQIQEKI